MSYEADVIGSPFEGPTKSGDAFVFYPFKGQSIEYSNLQVDNSVFYNSLKDRFKYKESEPEVEE